MSPTVRPLDLVSAAGCVIGDCWTTVFVSLVSIAPVAIRIAPITTATPPPTRPEMTFELLTVLIERPSSRRATLTRFKREAAPRDEGAAGARGSRGGARPGGGRP